MPQGKNSMKRTIDYYCARVEDAQAEFINNPRTLNNLLNAIDDLRTFRLRAKQDKSQEQSLFK